MVSQVRPFSDSSRRKSKAFFSSTWRLAAPFRAAFSRSMAAAPGCISTATTSSARGASWSAKPPA